MSVRLSVERFSPFSKIRRCGWEEAKGAGVQPAARSICHISVQAEAAFLIPIWLPVWFWSHRKAIPAGLATMQALLPEPLNVGVGQNEEPFAQMRPADFRR